MVGVIVIAEIFIEVPWNINYVAFTLKAIFFFSLGLTEKKERVVCVCGCENHAMNLWMDENIIYIYMNKLDVILIIYKSQSDKIHRNTEHKKHSFTSPNTKSLPMTLIHVFE